MQNLLFTARQNSPELISWLISRHVKPYWIILCLDFREFPIILCSYLHFLCSCFFIFFIFYFFIFADGPIKYELFFNRLTWSLNKNLTGSTITDPRGSISPEMKPHHQMKSKFMLISHSCIVYVFTSGNWKIKKSSCIF